MPKRKYAPKFGPLRKGYKRYKGRRGSSKKTSARTAVKLFGPSPIPSRYVTKMKYNQTFDIAVANANQVYFHGFRLNSINDPDLTNANGQAGAHRPYGYDTFIKIFNQYRVFACRYTLRFFPSGSAANTQVVTIPANDGVPLPAGTRIYHLAERPRAQHRVLNYIGAGANVIKGKVNLPKLIGMPSKTYKADEETSAKFDQSPIEDALLFIFAESGAASVTVRCNLTMTFYVECFDPIQQAQSLQTA